LWTDAGLHLEGKGTPSTVCVGNEWYRFPSHFFLPSNARLEYIDDGFKGVLPQHYPSLSSFSSSFSLNKGTSSEPAQPFNNLNQEERSRYLDIHRCDYFIGSTVPSQLTDTFNLKEDNIILKGKVIDGAAEGKNSLFKSYFIPYQEPDSLTWKYYKFIRLKEEEKMEDEPLLQQGNLDGSQSIIVDESTETQKEL
jgi:hypothetical protein